MSTLTKEWLLKTIAELEEERDAVTGVVNEDAAMALAAMKLALASLEAEAVSVFKIDHESSLIKHVKKVVSETNAPPAPVSVPDMATPQSMRTMFCQLDDSECAIAADVWNACRAAMLQGAEHVMMAYKLPDDFDFDRFNDVVWLEAVASNPHMHSLTTSTIAMVALELNKRLEAGNSPVIPDGLRLALSNAGIAAPESDEMLAATCEKYIQALVTWVKDRKPFRSAVIPDGWVACSERMPEVGVKVLCFPVNDEPIHATYNGQVWLQDISWSTSDEPIDNVISCNVFHWMPLPAAPQQE